MAENASSRGAVWLDEEILALLSIWGDEKVQEELDGAEIKLFLKNLRRRWLRWDLTKSGSSAELK